MKIIKKIISDRDFQNWPSWHIVYEWENEIRRDLNIELKKSPSLYGNVILKKLWRLDEKVLKNQILKCVYNYLLYKERCYLYFEMFPQLKINYSNNKYVIPIIIDYWSKNTEEFIHYYKNCKYILFTNLEVIETFKNTSIKNKIIHFPISISSKYYLAPNQYFEKEYDLVLAGRTNPILYSYLKEYELENPDLEYLYQEEINGVLCYLSNQKGYIGQFHTREDYMTLLKKSKIAFYATPGIDGGETRTNGFNPVTPRFLELLASGCYILARYIENLESDFFKLKDICPNIVSYEVFKIEIEKALKSPQPIERNSVYLKQHYTSERMAIIRQIDAE